MWNVKQIIITTRKGRRKVETV